MLFWLDGYTNTRPRPQENFGREIMELFTMGVGHYTEPDVYAAARVFTGWNLLPPARRRPTARSRIEFIYNAGQHDTAAKTFSFPIYKDGNNTIPARAATTACRTGSISSTRWRRIPNTGRYLAKKLYRFFVSEIGDVERGLVDRIADVYHRAATT